MQKDDQRVERDHRVTRSDYYDYSFIADGVGMFDPSIMREVQTFCIARARCTFRDRLRFRGDWRVPHGEIHHHFYKSGVVGDDRGYYVYTRRATIHAESKRIPSSTCCTDSGRRERLDGGGPHQRDPGQSHRARQSETMLVAMPLGYGAPGGSSPNSGVWRDRAITERNFNKFREALLTE